MRVRQRKKIDASNPLNKIRIVHTINVIFKYKKHTFISYFSFLIFIPYIIIINEPFGIKY